jgi:hypothetical protein
MKRSWKSLPLPEDRLSQLFDVALDCATLDEFRHALA